MTKNIYPPPPPSKSHGSIVTPRLTAGAITAGAIKNGPLAALNSGHHHITKLAGATLYGFTLITPYLASRILIEFNGLGIGDTGMFSEYRRAFFRESATSFREVFVGGGVERPQLPCGMNGDMIAAMDELRDVAAAGEINEVHWQTYADAVDRNIVATDPDFREVFIELDSSGVAVLGLPMVSRKMSAVAVSADGAASALRDLGNAIGNLIKRGWRK